MKQFTLIISLLVMLASCGPAPTPSATPDLNATMSAFSGTMVAGTLTAQPTKTLPPTETATPLPTETATLPPTATLDPALPTATLGAALPGMPTPTAFSGAFVPGDLTGLETAILRVENLSGVKEIIVTIEGVTRPREIPVYLSYKVTGALNINIYMGSWQYKVEIPNKRFMTGAFKQTNKDKTTMKVYLTKIAVLGP
jgi:hypothetical protein